LELVAATGFDWVCVDLQHGHVGRSTLPGMLQAAAAADTPALVRPNWNHPALIGNALDVGAAGVIVPLVNTAAEAAAAAAACRYPPSGNRSSGQTRPVGGAESAGEPVCLVMVETVAAVEAVAEIAATPGIDGIFVGPSDLSLSATGRLGGEIAALVETVASACRRAGIIAGIACGDAEDVAAACALGFQLLTVEWDVSMLTRGAAGSLAAAREAALPGGR
jgi:4-hydroxy-2-oxoheptanedioate aldolase